MTLDDRLTRGFMSGVLAGAAQTSITLPLYYTKKTKLRWLDFASVVLFGKCPTNVAETITSEMAMLMWSGLLGTGFTYAIPSIGERNYRAKGALYGVSSWFAIYAIIHLYDIPQLKRIDKNTVIAHGLTAILWGLVLSESIHRLERKVEHQSALQEKTYTHITNKSNQDYPKESQVLPLNT